MEPVDHELLDATWVVGAEVLGRRQRELAREREAMPRAYAATLDLLVARVRSLTGGHAAGTIGISLPGMIGPEGELVRMVNLPWLEGRPLRADLAERLGWELAKRRKEAGKSTFEIPMELASVVSCPAGGWPAVQSAGAAQRVWENR